MKVPPIALMLFCAAGVSAAQSNPSPSQTAPDLQLTQTKWTAYGNQPEQAIDVGGVGVTSVANAIGSGMSTINATSSGQVYYQTGSGSLLHPPSSKHLTPVDCQATVLVKNTGSKTIKAFDLDWVFRDPADNSELLRYRFHAKTNIKPGNSKSIVQDVYQKIGKYHKRYTPLKPSKLLLLRTKYLQPRFVFQRIKYSDGTFGSESRSRLNLVTQ